MRSLFTNPSDREAGDKADDEDERLVSRYAEGPIQLIQDVSSFVDLLLASNSRVLHNPFIHMEEHRIYQSRKTMITNTENAHARPLF